MLFRFHSQSISVAHSRVQYRSIVTNRWHFDWIEQSESLTPISTECNIAGSLLNNPNPVVTYFYENHEHNRLPTR
jgi:hypothetical protein